MLIKALIASLSLGVFIKLSLLLFENYKIGLTNKELLKKQQFRSSLIEWAIECGYLTESLSVRNLAVSELIWSLTTHGYSENYIKEMVQIISLEPALQKIKSINQIKTNCKYFTGYDTSVFLKCGVNPASTCSECGDYQPTKSEENLC